MLRYNMDGIGKFSFTAVRPEHFNPFGNFDFSAVKKPKLTIRD
jgi:hypothetical protein